MIVQKSAVIVDFMWRYRLDRIWAPEKGTVAFVMLNPSTADAEQDDATIRRCVGFAQDWGYGHLAVVNLYGFRATDPKELKEWIATDEGWAIGRDNGRHVIEVCLQAQTIVAAWGANAPEKRVEAVRATFRALGVRIDCLGYTKSGQPVHPLRQPKNAMLRKYMWERDA
jgi:hypothetical protein